MPVSAAIPHQHGPGDDAHRIVARELVKNTGEKS